MKYILLFLFSITLLQASYTKGLQLYKQGNYKQAIEELQNSYSEYGNKKLHLLWAKSAQKLGHTKEAMSAYERVLMLDEKDIEASLALLKIYKDTKRTQLALELKEKVEKLQLTQKQQKQFSKVGDITIQKLSMQGDVALGYDTNVNSSPDSTTFKKESSPFLRVSGSMCYKRDLHKKSIDYFQADASFYYQNNFNASTYNMFLMSFSGGAGYKWKNYDFLFPLTYTKLHFLDQDLYGEFSFVPTFWFKPNKESFVKAKLHYASRSYNSSSSLRDDTKIGIEFNGFYVFKQDLLFGRWSYLSYKADKSSFVSFIDKDVYSLTLGYKHPLHYENITATALYKWKKSSFKSREDTQHKIDITLTKPFMKNIDLRVVNQYTTNNSNYAPAKYNKYILMFGVTLRR